MGTPKQAEAKVYAVGTQRGRAVIFLVVNGNKVIVPTDVNGMAKLAELGVLVQNV